MNPVIGIAVKDVKMFFREKGTLFWTIAFPVMILLLFTAIFGREIPFTATIGVVNQDSTAQLILPSLTSALNDTEIFNVLLFENKTEALKEVEAGNIRAVLTFPDGFEANMTTFNPTYITLAVDETDPDTAQIVRSGIENFVAQFYKSFYSSMGLEYKEPVALVEETSVTREKLGYKEHMVPGILVYPLLFSSMVSSTGAIVYEREKGTLKRIRASSIHPMHMLLGKTLAALFQTAISILIIAVLAAILLNPRLNWNLPLLAPILFLGSMNGIALGLLISCIGRSPQEASNAATTIAIVLQFFTGMYFPLEFLPTYLQQIGSVIPMTYASEALRDIMIRNAGLEGITQPIITLSISAIALYAIGILLYKRWVEKE